MKVKKGFKILMVISSLMLVISACGKGSTGVVSTLGSPYLNGTCNASATGNNIYTADSIQPPYDNYYPYGAASVTGSLKLTINSAGGLTAGQYAASAVLTLNGSQYCCTSQGVSNVLGYPDPAFTDVEEATVSGLALPCQSMAGTGTTPGYFSGGYQTVTLRIGVATPMGGDMGFNGLVSLRKDKTMRGYIEVSSGVQNVTPMPNSGIYKIGF